MDEGQDQGCWNTGLQNVYSRKKIISKMYSCTYFGHYRKLYSCTTDDEITMCVSWFGFFFFILKRESSSKMWSEIVNWLTLKCMQDMITFCFQQNYKGESMCYVTRGNSNKQKTWCSDSHNWKRWLRYTHLCYFNQVMRTTISWFFSVASGGCLSKVNSQLHKILLGIGIFISS